MTTMWDITFDCAAPAALAAFWKLALGYGDAPPPQGFDSWDAWFVANDVPDDEREDGAAIADPDGVRPGIGFLKVPEGKTAKNRLHLDLKVSGGRAQPADLRAERIRATVSRLVEAGGSVLSDFDAHGSLDHVTMADPEGNDFCVV
jgi:hypothetical protein